MLRPQTHHWSRNLTLLIATLFAIFPLFAASPHGHGVVCGRDGVSVSGVVLVDHIDCALCNWLTVSYVAPIISPVRVFLAALPIKSNFVPSTVHLCRLVVPHRRLRAPPIYSC